MPEVDFDINVTDLYDAIGKSDWDAASSACRRNPIEAETWVVRRGEQQPEGDGGDDNASVTQKVLWRFLPLHSACARRPPERFVRHLLDAYPEAASVRDESGMYPLHYACGNRASKSVIEQLMDAYPLAVREVDPHGMLPIHYIAQWGPSEDGIVDLLLEEYAEGASSLNAEGTSPLDLCKERNYDEWKEVLALLEDVAKKKKNNPVRDGSIGGSSHNNVRKMVLNEDSLISSTIEVRSGKKSPRLRSSSLPRVERAPSSTRRDERTLSRTRSERSSSRSRGASSRVHAEDIEGSDQYDARDEMPTPRGRERSSSRPRRASSRGRTENIEGTNHYGTRDEIPTPRSVRQYESRSTTQFHEQMGSSQSLDNMGRSIGKPPSIVPPSPRYHEMKTPRSSGRGPGRGPGFNFSQRTPRSTSGRSVEFDFETSSQSRGSVVSAPPTSLYIAQSQDNSQGSHRLHPPPSPSLLNHQSKHEKMGQQQVMAHLSQKKDYQVSLLQNENHELRTKLANYEMLQKEHTQLCARLANYDAIHNENAHLRAKLEAMEKQNRQLHSSVADLQDIVDIAEKRENARMESSAGRRKMLLEMLAAEEKQEQVDQAFLYKGDNLGNAFGRQIRSIDGLRREMADHFKIGGNQFISDGAMVGDRHIGYRMNGAYE